MVKLNAKLEINSKGLSKLKKDIQRIVDNKIINFIDRLSAKINNIAIDLAKEMNNLPVVKFIKGKGRGELGLIDPDNVFNKMLAAMVTSSISRQTKNKQLKIEIGKIESMRIASSFLWTTSGQNKPPFYKVNLFSLIENEPIPGAGWDGTGVPNAAFVKVGGRRLEGGKSGPIDLSKFSRTGEGLMVSLDRDGARPYKLPLRHVNGFSKFLKQGSGTEAFARILDKYFREALTEAGIKPSSKIINF